MVKSSYNRGVIGNFILYYTHQNEYEATGEARQLYDELDTYIEVDHVDGVDGDDEGDITIGASTAEKEEVLQDIDYLFSKINWKDSFLDGKAVEIMNGLKSKIKQL